MVDNLDGFKLAEIDLQIRGEGKVTGTSQSGISDLKIADLYVMITKFWKNLKVFWKYFRSNWKSSIEWS